MNLISKTINFARKILSGEEVISLKRGQDHWDDQFKRGYWKPIEEMGQNLGVVSRFVVAHSFEKEINVLDVGCGSGVQGQYLAEVNGVNYYGSDISAEAVAQAKERVPKGTFWVGSMENGIDSDLKFDVIIFAEVLLYTDYKNVIKKFQKNLKDDGFIIISLYKTWRTRYIWRDLKKVVKIHDDVSISDNRLGIRWRVCTCLPKKI